MPTACTHVAGLGRGMRGHQEHLHRIARQMSTKTQRPQQLGTCSIGTCGSVHQDEALELWLQTANRSLGLLTHLLWISSAHFSQLLSLVKGRECRRAAGGATQRQSCSRILATRTHLATSPPWCCGTQPPKAQRSAHLRLCRLLLLLATNALRQLQARTAAKGCSIAPRPQADFQQQHCWRTACRVRVCNDVLPHTHCHDIFYLRFRKRENISFSGAPEPAFL